MTKKAKNICTVTLKQQDVHIGTFRQTQDIFIKYKRNWNLIEHYTIEF